ncbi:MAG: prepilin-type N-terminal cleavage/methylation domain-containing protein [Planctomycetes bacterium]|nr:prepilin-type N-terminal cleavage/methylation domain-containing protein [Planctomycetota bacterium]
MSRAPNRRRCGGFTLVEVMTACAITSVLALAAVTVGQRSQRDADRTRADVAELQHVQRATERLTDDLRACHAAELVDGALTLAPLAVASTTGAAARPVRWAVDASGELVRSAPTEADARFRISIDSLQLLRSAGLVHVGLRMKPRGDRAAAADDGALARRTLWIDVAPRCAGEDR